MGYCPLGVQFVGSNNATGAETSPATIGVQSLMSPSTSLKNLRHRLPPQIVFPPKPQSPQHHRLSLTQKENEETRVMIEGQDQGAK